MTVSEVRTRYLEFFKARGHVVIPSAPIVPGNDPTTLFTSSGMQPLLSYFLGKDHPEGKRIVNSQLSFRAGDIEEVGDNRHTTFFEMLGNWSFGDYFKKEQLSWIFEFLTDVDQGLGLDPRKIYVTVYAGDDDVGVAPDIESIEIWKELFGQKGIIALSADIGSEEVGYARGIQKDERIFSYTDKNWWSRAGVPKNMPAGEPGGPDSELFYDFGTPHDTRWGEYCHPNCDCGRFIEIGNSVFMQFIKNEDGSFSELPRKNVDFGGGLERLAIASLGTPDVFLLDVFEKARTVLEQRSGKRYEDAESTRSFRIILDHMRASSFMLAESVTPSNTEAGYVLRRLIRRSMKEADRLGITDAVLADVAEGFAQVYVDHYPHVQEASHKIRDELIKEEERFRKTLSHGLKEFQKLYGRPTSIITPDDVFMLFTTYGFPVEMTEELAKEHGIKLDMEAVGLKMKEHQETSRAGGAQRFAGGLADHSEQTVKYHTIHHILLRALQMVLGDEVKQRGSNITSERLRIDFTSPGKMTDEQKVEVEKIVNDVIDAKLPVIRTVMPREEAEKLGAQMEFGVKYPDMVSVYSVGPSDATDADPKLPNAFSLEFCGGPHVTNTRDIGEEGKKFNIQKEEAVAQGIRRIKGVLV